MSTLAKMSHYGAVSNLPPHHLFIQALHDTSVCGACQEGGQKAKSFPRTPVSERTSVPYAKLHADMGEMKTVSAGGAKWFTVLVDEATGFYWVFTHSTKANSADFIMAKLSQFIADGHKVRMLRWDRDPVFRSHAMQHFLKQNNITDTPTSGYSPQENGHAERAVGVLKERVQSMLSDSGLSDAYWAEALWHACYISNITSSTGSTTPWELIKAEKPDASNLRIWGCKAWKLIPPAIRQRNRLARKSDEVRYLGIAWPNPKAFRVLTSTGKVELSRHVEFDESAPPACAARADFSPFMETVVETVPTAPQPTSPVPSAPTTAHTTDPPPLPSPDVPSTSQLLPDLSPLPDAEDSFNTDDAPYNTATPAVSTNPLFQEHAQEDSPPPAVYSPTSIPAAPAILSPTPPSPSAIPAPVPRRSERSNRGVPADTYARYISGLPGARHKGNRVVSFRL